VNGGRERPERFVTPVRPMTGTNIRGLVPCLALFLLGASADSSGAQPLSLYQDEAQARLHCSGDAVVWLDFQTRRYYAAGQARYARGRNAVFTCRNQARRSGYRRSIFGRR
jgi:hypothetical protein